MDLQIALIGIGVFVLSSVLIYFISVLGIKEKSFEEAQEDQRRQIELEKQKAREEKKAEKDKKKRKSKEKTKEKVSQSAKNETEEAKMVNLEIEPEIIEPVESSVVETKKGTARKRQPKSILHNKDEEPLVASKTVNVVHAIIPPKDEVELLHKKGKSEEVGAKEMPPKTKTEKHLVGDQRSPKKTPEIREEPVVPKIEAKVSKPVMQEKKIQQSHLITDTDKLVASLQAANFKDYEVESLIDVLLNKQGSSSFRLKTTQKGDPVGLLRKQLEEKERALQEEQRMAMNSNACLAKEKANFASLEKQYQGKISSQNQEIQALKSKMQVSMEQHMSERTTLQTTIQQMKLQLSDQSALYSLREENKNLKDTLEKMRSESVSLQDFNAVKHQKNIVEDELQKNIAKSTSAENARKTAESKLADVNAELNKLRHANNDSDGLSRKQAQEAEKECAALKSRLHELEKALSSNNYNAKDLEEKLKDAEQQKTAFQTNLKATEQKLAAVKENKTKLETDFEVISKSKFDLEQKLKSLEKDLTVVRSEKSEFAKQIESAEKNIQDVQSTLKSMEKKVSELESINSELKKQCDSTEKNKLDLQSKLTSTEKKVQEVESSNLELKKQLDTSKQENAKISQELCVAQSEVSVCKENASKAATAPNGDIHMDSIALAEHEKRMSEKEAEIDKLTLQVQSKSSELSVLHKDVEDLKKKNNDLRSKNWKAMEALNEAEKLALNKSNVKDNSSVVKNLQSQDKGVLKRLFPDVSVNDSLEYTEWVQNFEKEALNKLSANKTAQNDIVSANSKVKSLEEKVTNLQSQLQQYKSAESNSAAKVKSLELKIKDLETQQKSTNESSSANADLLERNKKLEEQVQDYLDVLATTESKLQQLENSVEGEEKKWHEKVLSLQNDLKQAKEESDSLKAEMIKASDNSEALSELEFAYRCLEKSLTQITDEMNEKVLVLEDKLKFSEDHLTEKEERISTLLEEIEKLKSSDVNMDDLLQQIAELKKALADESKKSKDLAMTNVKLNGIIKTGQDSLKQEQELVDKLKKELENKQGPVSHGNANEIAQLKSKLEEKDKQIEKELLAKKQLSQRLVETNTSGDAV